MFRTMCKSKIHRVTITEANLHYTGSITIDEVLMEAADILPGERVQIVNLNNGSRVETYVLPGMRNSGYICLNGAAARWGMPEDLVIITSHAMVDDKEAREFVPKVIFVNEKNEIVHSPAVSAT